MNTELEQIIDAHMTARILRRFEEASKLENGMVESSKNFADLMYVFDYSLLNKSILLQNKVLDAIDAGKYDFKDVREIYFRITNVGDEVAEKMKVILLKKADSFDALSYLYIGTSFASDELFATSIEREMFKRAKTFDDKLDILLRAVSNKSENLAEIQNRVLNDATSFDNLARLYVHSTFPEHQDECVEFNMVVEEKFLAKAETMDDLKSVYFNAESSKNITLMKKSGLKMLEKAKNFEGKSDIYRFAKRNNEIELAEKAKQLIYETSGFFKLSEFYITTVFYKDENYKEVSRYQLRNLPVIGKLFRKLI